MISKQKICKTKILVKPEVCKCQILKIKYQIKKYLASKLPVKVTISELATNEEDLQEYCQIIIQVQNKFLV
ncbi:hypothetical protein OXYTRIMIC_657 [Oxytricha trifallax]|uniref:Uncharacterized protein n=1 Tax=Oxytricha trifallax TaxID=1172189 RepID=A0A073I0D1_9SPIT|nr:hypothetical protein OXYTRIMIC_657 [Oxytricha trifallax]